MRTRAGLLLLLMVLAGAVAPASTVLAQPEQGGLSIRLLDAPVDRRDDPRALVYIIDHVEPGASLERRIELANTSGEQLDVSLYAAAAVVADGEFSGLDGRAANDLSRWIAVEPESVVLAPGDATAAPVSITVPADAPPGEQYAAVWAEVRDQPDAGGVTAVHRVGIRVYLSVGAGGEPATDFTVEALTARRRADGLPLVAATVRNTGGRALDLSGALELTEGPGGLAAGPFDAQLGTTLEPGGVAPIEVALDPQLPRGPWTATLTLRSGTVERTVTGTITFPEAAASEAEPVLPVDASPQDDEVATPVLIVAALLLLVLIAVLAYLLLKRRRVA